MSQNMSQLVVQLADFAPPIEAPARVHRDWLLFKASIFTHMSKHAPDAQLRRDAAIAGIHACVEALHYVERS